MSNKTIILTENQKEILKNILLEDKEGKNLAKARHYLVSKGYSSNDAQQVLNNIRTDIPNTRMAQCKFILGAVRLYLQGQLSDGHSIHELNNTLKYIASDAHVNEYDNNLNNESLQVLVNRFKGVMKNDLKQSMAASNARQLTVNQGYTIVPINNFEDASKYGRYTSWCVTHSENMLNSYTSNGTGRFYFCLRNGFENEPKVKGEGSPLDRYGLSMIAVSVDMEGAVHTITCRWNHDMGGNDSVMTVEELENLLGRNFYQTFKPYTREELHAKGVVLFDEVQALLDSGKKPKDIFDAVYSFIEGFAVVLLNRKCNFINTEGKIISDVWFDGAFNFIEGFAIVKLNEKWNFINTEGKIISDTWFDYVFDFKEGFARVKLNGKWNFINQEGKVISNTWFEHVDEFVNGFVYVKLNNKWNFINTEGNLLSNIWFDAVFDFKEGFAIVRLNGKFNFINTEGKIVSDTWFDDVYDFKNGFAQILLNDKDNFIDTEGKIISDIWFDFVSVFRKGFARVKLNGKYNFINTEGKIISGTWFEDADNFSEGFASVKLNGKWYRINKGGKIVESKNRNGKTIIITESQKKKLKKAIAAQDQVGGKVNAGVMDAVVGGGMCENVEEDEYMLGAEQNEISPYYHVTEEKLNESPDYVEALSLRFSNDDAVAFLSLSEDGRFYIGEQGETHADIIKKIDDSLYDEFMSTVGYDNICDETMTGRYWKNDNVLSLWRTPINKRLNIRKVINELSSNGIITDSNYTLIDYWDTDDGYDLIFPVKWLFNGTFDIFNGRCTRIAPVNVNEYKNTGKYTYFSVTLQGQGTQIVNLNGNEFLTGMQYYMKTSLGEAKEHERMVDIRQIIASDRFKTWFGNSKVVDENGMPLVVHHGSPKFIGDKFNKKLTGKSMNYGEEGVFCTTQDLSWAKRFSYPASQGTSNFTVNLDYNKPGDILSGFLKIEKPLDFFNLKDNDWKNIENIITNSSMNTIKIDELKRAISVGNHQFVKQAISSYNNENFGNVLKKYGYDGYIALMDKKSTAKEYCFIEPNQFKSIYSLSFNPKSDSIYEAKKKKIIKNDKGEIVPEKCKKCGGKVVCQIHGEPVYICKDCGEYYGTMPFTLKENKLNESWEDLSDIYEEYSVYDLLCKFQDDKEKGITKKQWNLIPAQQYHTLLKRYMYSPEMAKIPYNVVNNWFMNIIVPNALDISYITGLAGHSSYFPEEDVEEFFGRYYEPIDISGFHDWSEKLDELGFYDWCVFPDGSDAWSDYGIEPLFNIINEYSPNSSAEDILILINRCLDVVHWRGDLSSGFIQGGKQSCDYISNVTESIKKRSKTLNEENTSIDKKALYLMIYAKNTYGITDNFDSCGFILLNGELLDFGNYDDIYRQSHGALDLKGANFRDFINSGNIRVNPQSPGIEFSKEPTEKQYVKISEMIAKYEGKDAFYVDCVNNEGANIWNKAYKPEERQNIISDIKEYFNNGKTPVVKGNDVLCGYSLRDFIGENVENEIAPEDVDLSSFVIKKKLNPDFWIDGHLDSRVRMKLLDIADDFIEEIGIDTIKPIDVIMTGSLANFNWNEKYSDIDLHIVYDFSEIDDNVEFLKKYFDSKKQLWNQKHTNLKILGYNVEVYVQDINEPHMSSGVYSLDKDKWLVKPDREILASSKVNKEFIKNKCSYYTEKIDELLYLYKKAKNDKHKIEKILIKADKLFNEIKQLRKIGFEKSNGKEINNYNILFKFLRRKNYLNKLSVLKTKCYDIINGF